MKYDVGIHLLKDLDDQDWQQYAARLAAIAPVLGAFEAMHAKVADGNPPSVKEWPRHSWSDAKWLRGAALLYMQTKRPQLYKKYLRKLDN